MKQIVGDMWEFASQYDAVCITTNGYIRGDGNAVMGRGCALEAAKRWPQLPKALGGLIRLSGNHVHWLKHVVMDDLPVELVSFPVKYRWDKPADIGLIRESAQELVEMVGRKKWSDVLIPRPGCGNGRLHWDDVRPVLAAVFDDRFTVISKPGER